MKLDAIEYVLACALFPNQCPYKLRHTEDGPEGLMPLYGVFDTRIINWALTRLQRTLRPQGGLVTITCKDIKRIQLTDAGRGAVALMLNTNLNLEMSVFAILQTVRIRQHFQKGTYSACKDFRHPLLWTRVTAVASTHSIPVLRLRD